LEDWKTSRIFAVSYVSNLKELKYEGNNKHDENNENDGHAIGSLDGTAHDGAG
jgi:hypothetical protein